MTDDVWIALMMSYWRIQSAIDRAVREGTDGMPDFLVVEAEKEIRATAYAEEQRVWGAGFERLCELHAVPEGEQAPVQQVLL